jgi:hypothetical protein
MMSEDSRHDEHVDELLSGFIDGELTQQDRQRVRLHCETCKVCKSNLEELRSLREAVSQAKLSDLDQDIWRETMEDTTVKATRGLGWLLLVGGLLIGAGLGVYEIVTSPSSMTLVEKLIVGGVYGGMLLIFISVLRQRLIARKTDRYKDVEI